jgi:hypothetical protein
MPEKQGIGDLVEMVKTYAKQETLDPLQGVGRWIGFGVAGSVLMMIGLVSLSLAMLRVLQEETGSTFTGNLSWLPHAFTFAAVLVIIGALASRIAKRTL